MADARHRPDAPRGGPAEDTAWDPAKGLAWEPRRGAPVILGAGIAGLSLAWAFARRGVACRVLDAPGPVPAASPRAGGMLAPVCESWEAPPLVASLGRRSLALWRDAWAALLPRAGFTANGTLVVAHPRDAALAAEFHEAMAARGWGEPAVARLDAGALGRLEPDVAERFSQAFWVKDEAHLDPRATLAALREALAERGVRVVEGASPAGRDAAGRWRVGDEALREAFVIDARGLGAGPPLRGVRGEAVIVRCPDVVLRRPVRVLHPRHPLYVVPRADGVFYVGATQIESGDPGPVSVRSTAELLSAAMVLNPRFGEARILECVSGLRPAYPDNAPAVHVGPGCVAVNGFHRHGFLLAPAVAEAVATLALDGRMAAESRSLFRPLATGKDAPSPRVGAGLTNEHMPRPAVPRGGNPC